MLSSSLSESFSRIRHQGPSLIDLIKILKLHQDDWSLLPERQLVLIFRPISRRIFVSEAEPKQWHLVLPEILQLNNPVSALDILICFIQTMTEKPPASLCSQWYALTLDPRILRFHANIPLPPDKDINPRLPKHRLFEHQIRHWNYFFGPWPFSDSRPAPPEFLHAVLKAGPIKSCVIKNLATLTESEIQVLLYNEKICIKLWNFICNSSDEVISDLGSVSLAPVLSGLWKTATKHRKIPQNCYQELLRLQTICKSALPGPDLALIVGKSRLKKLAPALDSLLPSYEY